MRYTLALLLLLAIPALFAAQAWKIPMGGAVGAKPLFFDDKMIAGSQGGAIEYIYWQTGGLIKKIDTGAQISQLEAGTGFFAAASDSAIFVLDKAGNINRIINESSGLIYGIAAADRIYASTADGLKAYDFNGNLAWVLPQGRKVMTVPLVLGDRVVFGAGEDLVVAYTNGTEAQRLWVAQFWKSRPAVWNNIAYIGADDGKMYAVDLRKNKALWEYQTGAWIMSDPLYENGTVYFGSNDGYVYALNATTGALRWKTRTGDAVQGGMETASVGGKQVLIAGSNDNKAYMLEKENGEPMLVFQAYGWVHNPAFHGGMLFFGSYDGSVYAYVADRSCSIESPLTGESVGYKLVNVSGRVFSQYANARVSVRVNNGSWADAWVSGNSWSYVLDPNSYDFGNMFIECKASDSFGEESKSFTYVVVLRDANAVKSIMRIEAPSSATEGRAFQVRAYDNETQEALGSFQVLVAGKTFSGRNGIADVKIEKSGQYELVVRETGYTDGKAKVGVGYDLTMIIAILVVIAAVGATAFYLFIYKK